MKDNIQILIVDDQELIRDGLRHMLELEEDMEVMGDCASAEEALSQVESLTPDVVLMDIRMSGTDGIEACRRLKEEHPTCSVIILTGYDAYLPRAIEAGAAGYLLKNVRRGELAQAIRQVNQLRDSQEDGDTPDVFAEVQLVIPPPASTAQIMRLMEQLEQILHNNYASITHTVGLWDKGTAITILLQLDNLSAILDKLGNIPEVEKVEEETLARDAFSRGLRMLVKSSVGPQKRILVRLKQGDLTGNNSTNFSERRIV